MSLWVIVSADFLVTGGQDCANLKLARYLADRGDSVHLVAHRVDPALRAHCNVRVHHAPRPLGSALLGEVWLDRFGRSVAHSLRPHGARVIVNGGNCLWPGADVNWVHYVHAAHERQVRGVVRRLRYGWAHRRYLERERAALRGAKRIIANSHRTAADVCAIGGIDRTRIEVIYYGTDAGRFRPPSPAERRTLRARAGFAPGRLAVLFIGSLGDRRKGFDVAFDAWRMLCRDPGWDADLHVIGRGAELESWRSRARLNGLGGRIRFLGFREDVAAFLRAADALVSPTRYEAYGLAVHEALCCGLPALVSAGAGVAERYPHELHPLLLTDPADARELACRLRAWRRNPQAIVPALGRLSGQLRSHPWDGMAQSIVPGAGARLAKLEAVS